MKRTFAHFHPVASLLCVLFLFAPAWMAAQSKNIDAGVAACDIGDYKTAISELDKGLADPSLLKEKALARAYAYRAQARIHYLRKAKDNLPESSYAMVREYALGAYEDLKLAKKNDLDHKLDAQIATNTKLELQLLLDLADDRENKVSHDETPNEKKPALYQDMVDFSRPAMEIDKFNYAAYSHHGTGCLGLRDSTAALKYFHLADDWFFRSAPRDGDMTVAYIYIHIAELEWYLNKNFDIAMKALEEGRKMLDGEGLKIQSLSNRPPAEKSKLSETQRLIAGDIQKCELLLRKLAGK